MNTPPIPPKFKLRRVEDKTDDGKPIFGWASDSALCGCLYFDESCPFEREIFSAYVEREWRKRAERWHVLCERYEFDREEMDHDRISRFNMREIECREAALAWRAWAEQ
jgi:hypothetical protein